MEWDGIFRDEMIVKRLEKALDDQLECLNTIQHVRRTDNGLKKCCPPHRFRYKNNEVKCTICGSAV